MREWWEKPENLDKSWKVEKPGKTVVFFLISKLTAKNAGMFVGFICDCAD
jgi:hypothetical protein